MASNFSDADILHNICNVPSKDYQLGPIQQNLNYFFAEKRLIYQEKASFLHIVTKPVEPIFQGLEPIVRYRALKGTLNI